LRDDQSASLGYETRGWFEVLAALGTYGSMRAGNDHPESLSRTTPWVCCRFPNGAVAVAPHFREMEEGWSGGFARKRDEDEAYLSRCPPPSEALDLEDFAVAGHRVTYHGQQAMTFRVDARGELVAFAGAHADRVTIDGRPFVFADSPVEQIGWAPVHPDRRAPGGAVLQLMIRPGTGSREVRLPAGPWPEELAFFAEGPRPGSRGAPIPGRREEGAMVLPAAAAPGRWIYGVPC
jgi:hypothetical protein